ncbi:hypothetical protein BofuT4_P103000.1 [Botrytis cinerea T4]|uniref:Uncharacterized protein n=1 Tax=Botryotinia fuckeliana (strain T4) TaxID=999810 RepID=G2YBB4_BOTF4|nr:hypothetical protein BofuT4_P103000.1 [Botrytis cinerea T4]
MRGQKYVQLLDGVDIKDPEAIRRVVRQAVTLPPIDEVARQGIKACVSGPVSSLLGTSILHPTLVEQKAAIDIQKLWKRGKRYPVHIKRLIQDCDVTRADFLVIKGVQDARKYCLQAQEEERSNEEYRDPPSPDANEYQDLPDEEDVQKLPQAPNDTYKQEKRKFADHLRETSLPNKKQKRKQSVEEQSSTRKTSTEMQENQIELTPLNEPAKDGISNSRKQAVESGKPKSTPGTRMLSSLRDHNAVGITKSPDKSAIRLTRNSRTRSENHGIGSNEIVPPPQVISPQIDSHESQNSINALPKKLDDYDEPGEEETPAIGRMRQRKTVKQQQELILDEENNAYISEPQITGVVKKGGHGGARRGPAWEKRRIEKYNGAQLSNRESQEDQLGNESHPIRIENSSDNETVVQGQLDNQKEDIEMEGMQRTTRDTWSESE